MSAFEQTRNIFLSNTFILQIKSVNMLLKKNRIKLTIIIFFVLSKYEILFAVIQ